MKRGNPWVKYVWLAVIVYIMFTVGKLAYKNYQLSNKENNLRGDIATLENEVQDLKNQIVYFQSDSYKEKMLRAKLNMQKEGERVVVITSEPKIEQAPEPEPKKKLTNPEKWWNYFIGI